MSDSEIKLGWQKKLGYGSGDFGLNLFWQTIGFYLFFYYTEVIQISPSLVGVIFIIAGIWDAISDPIAGYVTERTKTKWGSYRPYLLFGSIPLAISFVLLFHPINIETPVLLMFYMTGILLFFRTCYTFVSIAYSALSARIIPAGSERIKLISVRMYCGFLGGMAVTAIAGFLQEEYPDNVAFSLLSILCGIIAGLVLLICFKTTHESERINKSDRPALSYHEMKATLLRNRAFVAVTLGIFMITIANSFIGTGLLYYFEYVHHDRLAGNSAIFLMIGTPLVTIPIWSYLAVKIGYNKTWKIGSSVATIGILSLLLHHDSTLISVAKFGLIAFGLSSFAVLFWNMLPDSIDYGEQKTGVRNEASIIGLASSSQKISIAFAGFIFGILLDWIGVGGTANEVSLSTSSQLIYILTIIPAISLIISVFVIKLYPKQI
ncbi:MFS transporter [Kordiimonas sp. SCSIO 12610]|uniref:MFS transporter n=1 Tax=Kordiimonas sp. SCSIO 12610 TaxID=2829597 RepID=UPI00210B452B|nr:MFS transporter [Kordiimonas sp. SCSIO 12610]UTW54707.1 MFS transporter [Kordiimonas sp. SCSIO 12610]